jgi:hypothetical protein
VQTLGVQVLSDPADGLDLPASLNVHLLSVVDTDRAVSTALRLPAYLPVSYIVTADGTVQQVLPPPRSPLPSRWSALCAPWPRGRPESRGSDPTGARVRHACPGPARR